MTQRLSHLSFQNQIILYQMNLKYSTHTILSTWGFNPLPADCKKFPRTHRSDALLCVLWCKNAINNFSDHKNKIVCTILYQPLVIQLKLLNMLSHNDILKISLPFFLMIFEISLRIYYTPTKIFYQPTSARSQLSNN